MTDLTAAQPTTLAAVANRMLLDGLASWLKFTPDLDLIATSATVDDLLAGSGQYASVALLDLGLRDGSDPVRNVRLLADSGMRVLVVSDIDRREHAVAIFKAGASGYLTKDHGLRALVRAVHDVAADRVVFSPELALSLRPDGGRPHRPQLSPQELAILTAYASGMTLHSAASRAGVKVGTAKEYLDRIKAKYSAAGRPTHTKVDLARRAREDGIAL